MNLTGGEIMLHEYEPNDDIRDQVRIIIRNFNEIQAVYLIDADYDNSVHETKKHVFVIDNACNSCQELLKYYKTGVKNRADLEFLIRKAKYILAKLMQLHDSTTQKEWNFIKMEIELLRLRFDNKFL